MDWTDFLTALGMVLVFEGIFPFANPSRWRYTLSMAQKLSDFQLRVGALFFMGGGVLIIYIARSLIPA